MNHKPNSSFSGVWTAIITPFSNDGDIDWGCFEKLLEEQVNAGVTGIVVAGTTGESPVLAVQEKLSLIRKSKVLVGKSVQIMAGSGDYNTQHSVELSRLAADAGADSLLVVTPPYSRPSVAGLIGHFTAIKKAVGLPICLYHVPARTAQFLTNAQLAQVCGEAKVDLIKEASSDVAYFSRAVLQTGIPVFAGDDFSYFPSLAVGGAGSISVVSNLFPKAWVKMTEAFRSGNFKLGLALHQCLLPMLDALFCEVNPCPLKAAMSVLGKAENSFRLPLAAVTAENFQRIKSTTLSTQQKLLDLV